MLLLVCSPRIIYSGTILYAITSSQLSFISPHVTLSPYLVHLINYGMSLMDLSLNTDVGPHCTSIATKSSITRDFLVQNNVNTKWFGSRVKSKPIAAKHFSPYIIQSTQKACLLTDSKPCVHAFDKLCRGEFSASPRVASFLSTVSRFQVVVGHLDGSVNVPSDFASRDAPECSEPRC